MHFPSSQHNLKQQGEEVLERSVNGVRVGCVPVAPAHPDVLQRVPPCPRWEELSEVDVNSEGFVVPVWKL